MSLFSDPNIKAIFDVSGGDVGKMATFLTQYKQLGVLKKIKGLLLGTFIQMEKDHYSPTIIELIKDIIKNPALPIAKTKELGHGQDSKCIIIGNFISLK